MYEMMINASYFSKFVMVWEVFYRFVAQQQCHVGLYVKYTPSIFIKCNLFPAYIFTPILKQHFTIR